MKRIATAVVALTLLITATSSWAVTFTANGSGNNGEKLKASATFVISNSDLVITLSNDGTYDPNDAADILTGILFKLPNDDELTPVSARLGTDSTVIAHPLALGFNGDVGGEWAYRNDLVRAPLGANEGISCTNLKWFKGKDLFGGPNLQGGKAPGGIDFGITTLDDLPGNNKGTIKNKGLIQDTIVLILNGLPVNFSLADISDVTFQYGSSLKQPEVTGEIVGTVPEPSTIGMVVAGLAVVLSVTRSRRKQS